MKKFLTKTGKFRPPQKGQKQGVDLQPSLIHFVQLYNKVNLGCNSIVLEVKNRYCTEMSVEMIVLFTRLAGTQGTEKPHITPSEFLSCFELSRYRRKRKQNHRTYCKVNKTKFSTKSLFNPKHNNTRSDLKTITITYIYVRANLFATPQMHLGKLPYFFNQ